MCDGQEKGHREYIKLNNTEQATISEYAAKHDPVVAIRHFKKEGSFPKLKESSVRGWRDAYHQEVLNQSTDRKRDRPVEVTELPWAQLQVLLSAMLPTYLLKMVGIST